MFIVYLNIFLPLRKSLEFFWLNIGYDFQILKFCIAFEKQAWQNNLSEAKYNDFIIAWNKYYGSDFVTHLPFNPCIHHLSLCQQTH